MSQTISSEAPDAVFGPANSGLHSRSLTLNSSSVGSALSVCWLVSLCISVFLSGSFCFPEDVPCVRLSCVQCTTPSPLFFSLLAFLRSTVITCVELYIQVNSRDGQPLFNAYVLCLYGTFHSLVLHSECGQGYALWVLPFVRLPLNFEVLCTKLCLGTVHYSHWHFVDVQIIWYHSTASVDFSYNFVAILKQL